MSRSMACTFPGVPTIICDSTLQRGQKQLFPLQICPFGPMQWKTEIWLSQTHFSPALSGAGCNRAQRLSQCTMHSDSVAESTKFAPKHWTNHSGAKGLVNCKNGPKLNYLKTNPKASPSLGGLRLAWMGPCTSQALFCKVFSCVWEFGHPFMDAQSALT